MTLTRTEDGKKTYSIVIASQYELLAEKLLNKQKQALIKMINKAVKSNHIALSEEEQNLLVIDPEIKDTEAPFQE